MKSEGTVATADVKNTILDEPVVIDRTEENIFTRRLRNASFRDYVLMFYDYRCAITDRVSLVEYGNLSNLEAAHIRAVAYDGGDHPSNGLPLNRDLHWAFDNGFITVGTDYKVTVHDKVKGSGLLKLIDKKQIMLPEDSRALPDKKALAWHNENVFGNFIRK